ncbi:MAG: hypothetical protein LAN83_00905 [Acidobacteriia bacterium]|nr:hypothetical protein [Terriglobia bacterium]
MALTRKQMTVRGAAAMRKQRSKAEAVSWALMAGPKRKNDLARSVLEYFAMGSTLAAKLSRHMEREKLPPEDGAVYMIGTDPDFAQPRGKFYQITSDHQKDFELLMAAADFHKKYVTIGLVVAVWDREKKQSLVFARPFIVSNPAVAPLLRRAVDDIRMKTTADQWAREQAPVKR